MDNTCVYIHVCTYIDRIHIYVQKTETEMNRQGQRDRQTERQKQADRQRARQAGRIRNRQRETDRHRMQGDHQNHRQDSST